MRPVARSAHSPIRKVCSNRSRKDTRDQSQIPSIELFGQGDEVYVGRRLRNPLGAISSSVPTLWDERATLFAHRGGSRQSRPLRLKITTLDVHQASASERLRPVACPCCSRCWLPHDLLGCRGYATRFTAAVCRPSYPQSRSEGRQLRGISDLISDGLNKASVASRNDEGSLSVACRSCGLHHRRRQRHWSSYCGGVWPSESKGRIRRHRR